MLPTITRVCYGFRSVVSRLAPQENFGLRIILSEMSSNTKHELTPGPNRKASKKIKYSRNHTRRSTVDGTTASFNGEENENSDKKNANRKNRDPLNRDSEDVDGSAFHIHEGSFASVAMREKHDRELPDITANSLDPGVIKRKVALVVGYIGTNYSGFQINADGITIHSEIEWALYKCGFLHPDNFGIPPKYGWSTSGRTDKGVHAAAQVCSVKLEFLPNQTVDDVRELLNRELPLDIRILDVIRTTRSFCARTSRDSVRYHYLIPSFLFASNLNELFAFSRERETDSWTEDELRNLHKTLATVRVTPDQLSTLKEAFHAYEGTKHFHNFSKRVSSAEGRSQRFIKSYEVLDPYLIGDMEWIPTTVWGQSFLIYQIRKMVGMAVDVARGAASMDVIRKGLRKDIIIKTAAAPGQGLFMEEAVYTIYNNRKSRTTDLQDIDFATEQSYLHQQWKEYKNVIVDHIAQEEARYGNFAKFLYWLEFSFMRHQFYDPEWNAKNQQSGLKSRGKNEDDASDEWLGPC